MNNKADIKNGWSLETIYEIIGDLVCFEFILKIKTLIKDVEVKSYLAYDYAVKKKRNIVNLLE